ncbi:MAG: hypothetical protein JXM69_09920 [Anaerolineae bacterium]|nr:hypothetical protein [Anaerolineae bacterium]
MKSRRTIILGILVVLLLICVGLVVFGTFAARQRDELDQEFADIMNVCRGQSVTSAATYNQNGGQNLLIAVESNVSGDLTIYTYAIPDDMLATTARDVALVLCLDAEREVMIESCPYYNVDDEDKETKNVIERYVYERNLKLIVAQTGEVLADETLRGDEPDECLEQESFRESQNVIKRKGDSISNGDLREWVRQFMASL